MVERVRALARREGELGVLLVVAVTIALLLAVFMSVQFFSVPNMQSMAIQLSGFGFLALAMGIAILSGGIDLSIVSGSVLAGIAGAWVMSGRGIPVTETNGAMLTLLGGAACLVVGLACGLLNGLLIAKISVPPILATLSTMILFSGIGMALTQGQSVAVVVPELAGFAAATLAGIPVMFLLLVVAFLVVGFLLTRTRFGRRLYLFGENQVALRFAGGRTERTVLLSYVLIGALVGMAAMIMVSRVNSARTGFGESYLLQSILVVVLAGFDPYGGRGRFGMLAIALLLLQSVSSAFNALGLSPFVTNLVWGAMLLLVMIANYYVRRWSARRPSATPSATAGPAPITTTDRQPVGAR
jgi:simple sugar transport system permease protein